MSIAWSKASGLIFAISVICSTAVTRIRTEPAIARSVKAVPPNIFPIVRNPAINEPAPNARIRSWTARSPSWNLTLFAARSESFSTAPISMSTAFAIPWAAVPTFFNAMLIVKITASILITCPVLAKESENDIKFSLEIRTVKPATTAVIPATISTDLQTASTGILLIA